MPSSRARRRRAQHRRGPATQTSGRPPRVEQAPPADDVRADEVAAEPSEVLEAEVLQPVDEAVADDELEPDELDDGDADSLEDEEAGVDAAVAELDAAAPDAEEGEEPARAARKAAATPATPDRTRSQNRNRRRGAVPQPQGPPVVRFFRETFEELRKVDWPTPSELYRYTVIVIVTVIVLAAFISGIDWVLQELFKKFIYGSSSALSG